MSSTRHEGRRNAPNKLQHYAHLPSGVFLYEDRQMFYDAAWVLKESARAMYPEEPEMQQLVKTSVATVAMAGHEQAQYALINTVRQTVGQGAVWNGANVAQTPDWPTQNNEDYLNAIGSKPFLQKATGEVAAGFEDLLPRQPGGTQTERADA
jgi:hypothetical protein